MDKSLKLGIASAFFLALDVTGFGWSPGTSNPTALQGFSVDTTSRIDVIAYYSTVYNASNNYANDMAWTGSVASGIAGTTSGTFQNDVLRRVNFYRGLVGLPANLTLTGSFSTADQQAALMFAANSSLSHTPPPSWQDFTTTGSNAANHSNIALGYYGPGAVDGYLADTGTNNLAAGHRRWLLYSLEQTIGTGDIPTPTDSSYTYASNAIWVTSNFASSATSQFVCWPNSGYTPITLTPPNWSLSYPGANFSAASVTMTCSGTQVPLTVVSNADNGYGDNTIVWFPSSVPTSISADTTYTVNVTGISGSGVPTSHSYNVTLFDPTVLGYTVMISGTSMPYSTGANYTFNAVPQADAYQVSVSTGDSAVWTEGAENATASLIQQSTTGTYALRQSGTAVVSGSYAFHLAFPDQNNQSLELLRDIIPTGSSQLQFYDLARYSYTTDTLNAEVSTDGGNTWTTVWTRNGVGGSSANWDTHFILNTVSLAAYAGQVIRLQFVYTTNEGLYYPGTTTDYGFFIDNITVTSSTQLENTTVTALSGTATSFTLNSTTAGAALTVGTTYYMTVDPEVGTLWWSAGQRLAVTAQTPSGYALWVANQYPQVTGGPSANYARDGLSNGLKYAFGLNPLVPELETAIPQPTISGSNCTVTFTQPGGVSGVVYGSQWSTDLVHWTSITDTGSGSTHTFSVGTTGHNRFFFRYQVVINTQ